ncbi:MAG: UvrB/UvrC motif-containing protein [Phycisphaerales bacterium]|jgi:protein arginine kinase activator|nr:UvrB/UvrC motif-containing protein [Phycisphaerales bacterium]
MKCDQCNRPAVVHQVIISNGTHREIHLCEIHATEAGVPNPGKQPINKLMAKIKQPIATSVMPKCPSCGTTLTHIRKSSLFGCPDCYDAFAQATRLLVESVQAGAHQHVGRNPKNIDATTTIRYESRRLVEELDRAVRAEQYERAAKIKAKLAELADPRPTEDEGDAS